MKMLFIVSLLVASVGAFAQKKAPLVAVPGSSEFITAAACTKAGGTVLSHPKTGARYCSGTRDGSLENYAIK